VTVSRWKLLRMRNVSHNILEKIKTHILCSVTFFPKIMPFVRQGGRVGQATAENAIRRMPFACWVTKATDIHSFPRQQWLRERAFMLLLYITCLSCKIYFRAT